MFKTTFLGKLTWNELASVVYVKKNKDTHSNNYLIAFDFSSLHQNNKQKMFNDDTGFEFIDTETILKSCAVIGIELYFMVS